MPIPFLFFSLVFNVNFSNKDAGDMEYDRTQ